MILSLDCEFNGFQGELISMALVSEDGDEFYEVLEYNHMDIHPWVRENVIPVLHKGPITFSEFQEKLEEFLCKYQNPVILADWPDDIKHICESLIVGAGVRLDVPDLTFMMKSIYAESKIPHNALEDARGISRYISAFKVVN